MKNQLLKLAFEIEIEEGEQLNLPSSIVQGIGKGKWVITIQPKNLVSDRLHNSFLNSYAPEDEGLYDDLLKEVSSGLPKFSLPMVRHQKKDPC